MGLIQFQSANTGPARLYARSALSMRFPEAHCIPDYTLVYEDLILDKVYDPRELGAQAGHLGLVTVLSLFS